MSNIRYTDYQISGNLSRTAKLGLLSYLSKKDLYYLTDKYFRDENGILHCAYSWNVITSQDELELEHIIPVSRNGGTVLFNVVPCRAIYNKAGNKFTSNLLDWWERSGLFKPELLENLINYMFEAYELSMKQNANNSEFIYNSDNPQKTVASSLSSFEMPLLENNAKEVKYNEFLLSCILKLQDCGIDVSKYKSQYDTLQVNNSFDVWERQRDIQKELLDLFKTYAPEYKYDIATSIDYRELLNRYNGKSNEEIIREIKKRIKELVVFCNEKKLSCSEVLHSIVQYQQFLYVENYDINELEKIAYKYFIDLYEELENFCKTIGWFPRRSIIISGRESKKITDCSEEELYELRLQGRFSNNVKRFPPEIMKKIKALKKEYGRQKIIETDTLYEDIISFSKSYWFPRGSLHQRKDGILTKEEEYEYKLYSSYRRHFVAKKFSKEQFDVLEDLRVNCSYTQVMLNSYFDEIVSFVEKRGYFPRTTGDEEEIQLLIKYSSNIDNFSQEQIMIINNLKTNKSFYNYNAQEVIFELKNFIKKYGRFPVSEVRRNGIRLKAEQFTQEEQYEVNLYAKYRRAKSRLPQEVISELELIKEQIDANNLYNAIIDFVDTSGHFPVSIKKSKDGKTKKSSELTPEELIEKRLYNNYYSYKRKGKFTSEQLIELTELQSSKNIYIHRATKIFEKLVLFVDYYKRFPRGAIHRDGLILNVDLLTEEEKNEVRLCNNYHKNKKHFTSEQLNMLETICNQNIEKYQEEQSFGRKAS